MQLPADQFPLFRAAVESAQSRHDVRQAVENIYLALSDAIELRKPICKTSGRCCHFDEYGHRLFITTMEIATFMKDLSQAGPFRARSDGKTCPFQTDKLCDVHAIRPFGCRIFFCDATARNWQQDQYTRFHAEFQRLHQRLSVPYFYVEWRQALDILHVASPSLL